MDTNLKRVIDLGKIAWTGKRRVHRVTLEVSLKDYTSAAPYLTIDLEPAKRYLQFSVSGTVYNGGGVNVLSSGQNVEEIAERFYRNALVQRIAELWRRWHLNGMRSGTRKQLEYVAFIKSIPAMNPINKLGHWDYSKECKALMNAGLYEDHGMRYGHQWLVEQIPSDVVVEIRDIINGTWNERRKAERTRHEDAGLR